MMGTLGRRGIIIWALVVLCLLLLPIVVKGEYILNMIFLVGVYTIMSQSWNIFGGYCGQISLGHAAFFGIGALSSRYIWIAGLPYPLVLTGGGLSSLILACVILIPALKLKSHYFAIGTLALAMIALITVTNVLPGVNFLPPELISSYSLITRYY
ncbi:MAG: hypothetical protein JRJ85_23120, partial [Deltaproteobacteria bacterium]|nr:hypothetical protein [Deltaproteobacteria bacterium]